MADDPIKFRCYRCGKLLGASPRKAGSVVECPRCRAEIQVPAPAAGESDLDSASAEPATTVAEEEAAEPDFAAIVAPSESLGDVPAIRIDPTPSAADAATPAPRAADVILPPGVVMAWSLLVLLAVPLAFVAGLLLGHFVWK